VTNLSEQQLSELYAMLGANPGFGGGWPGNSLQSQPMYNSIQNPGPPGFMQAYPVASMAMQFAGPAVASMLGYQNPRFMPQMTPSVDPFSVLFSQQATTPYTQTAEARAAQQIAGTFGGNMADMFDAMGFRPSDMSQTEFRDALSNRAGGQAGQMIAQFASASPLVQSVMGGNMVAAASQLQGSAMQLSYAAGQEAFFLDPETGELDFSGYQKASEHAANLRDSLFKDIYGTGEFDEAGKEILALTPDMDVTKGFSAQQIVGGLTKYMSQRDFAGQDEAGNTVSFRGASVEQQQKMLKDQVEVFEAARDLFGSNDMGELASSLNTLTSGAHHKIDPESLKQTLREMNALAKVFGVEGATFMQETAKVQASLSRGMGMAIGGSPTAMLDANGNVMGGLGSTAFKRHTQGRVMSLAAARGDMSEEGINQAGQEYSAFMSMAMNSKQGRDAMLVEYLKQNEGVSEEEYNEYIEAVSTGTKFEQERAAAKILEGSQFGTADRARSQMASSEAFRTSIAQGLGDEGFINWEKTVITAGERENIQRNKEQAAANALMLARDVGSDQLQLAKVGDEARIEAIAAFYDKNGKRGQGALIRQAGDIGKVQSLMRSEDFRGIADEASQAGMIAHAEEILGSVTRERAAGAELYRAGSDMGVDSSALEALRKAVKSGDHNAIKAAREGVYLSADPAQQEALKRREEASNALFDKRMDSSAEALSVAKSLAAGAADEETINAAGGFAAFQHNKHQTEAAAGIVGMGDFFEDLKEASAIQKRKDEEAALVAPKLQEANDKTNKYRQTPGQHLVNVVTGKRDSKLINASGMEEGPEEVIKPVDSISSEAGGVEDTVSVEKGSKGVKRSKSDGNNEKSVEMSGVVKLLDANNATIGHMSMAGTTVKGFA
jgi:hypothetical protein